jgi:predicted ATPase
MTENEIILLHDRLYEYLKRLHQADSSFVFTLNQEINAERNWKNGYWFAEKGSESEIISNKNNIIMSLGDNRVLETHLQTSSSLYQLEFNYLYEMQEWWCFLTINEKNKPRNFDNIVNSLGFLNHTSWLWDKAFASKNGFIQTLDDFLKNEKVAIDKCFKKKDIKKNLKEKEDLENQIQKIQAEKCLGHVKERYRLLYEKPKPHLPFAISRVEVVDFQGIKHLVIQDIPLDTQWIFLTGENGFGKTSVLRAIAKGLVGDEDLVESLPEESRIYVNGYNWNQPFFYSARSKTIAKNNFQVAMYGASRFRYHDDADKSKQKTFFLFSDEGKLTNIERVLITAERAKDREKAQNKTTTFDKLKKIFLHIIPQLADIKVEYLENELLTDREQVFYYEKGRNQEIFEPVRLEALAAGYRGILTMIGDMMIRLDDLQGVVLIDEIDAHLHPKYQYDLPRLLSEMFPKIQFVATTHSPIPLLSVPQNKSIVLTVERNLEKGITVERKDDIIDIQSLNPNALLTSPIFGFHHLFAVDAEAEHIAPVDHYNEVETMDKIKDRLKSLRQRGMIQ